MDKPNEKEANLKYPIIALEMHKRRLTKKQVSQCLGVHVNTLTNWLTGKTPMPIDVLETMSIGWCCSMEYLIRR